jgi:hypothetical protein
LKSAENGDGASVLCHVIADADGVNKRDTIVIDSPPAPLCPSFISSYFMRKLIPFAFFSQRTPLHHSAFAVATLKSAVFCCSATLMWRRRIVVFYASLLYKLILLPFFSQSTSLHYTATLSFLQR